MKKLHLKLLSTSLFAILCTALNFNLVAFAGDKVVATYKGGQIKESQIMEEFKPALDMQPNTKGKTFAELDRNTQEALIRGFANTKLLLQEAKAKKIESSKAFQEKLNNVKSKMLQQQEIENYLKSAVTDKMIDEEYNKMITNLKGKDEIKVSHILVDTESKAQDLKKKLSRGAKFDVLAKESSKDEGTKSNGGEIGYYITQGQLVPEFEDKAFSMKKGEISDPVKTQFGYHIIKLLDKRPATIPSKESEKQNIEAKLNREAVEKYLSELANKAGLKIDLPN